MSQNSHDTEEQHHNDKRERRIQSLKQGLGWVAVVGLAVFPFRWW